MPSCSQRRGGSHDMLCRLLSSTRSRRRRRAAPTAAAALKRRAARHWRRCSARRPSLLSRPTSCMPRWGFGPGTAATVDELFAGATASPDGQADRAPAAFQPTILPGCLAAWLPGCQQQQHSFQLACLPVCQVRALEAQLKALHAQVAEVEDQRQRLRQRQSTAREAASGQQHSKVRGASGNGPTEG